MKSKSKIYINKTKILSSFYFVVSVYLKILYVGVQGIPLDGLGSHRPR